MGGAFTQKGGERRTRPLACRRPPTGAGLVKEGAVRRLRLSVGDVTAAFKRAGNQQGADHPESADPATSFIDLYVAPVSIPAIGKRLLGEQRFRRPAEDAGAEAAGDPDRGERRLFLQGLGLCARRHFRPLRNFAGRRQHPLSRSRPLRGLAIFAPPARRQFQDVDLFTVPTATRFRSRQPWRLQLLAQRAYGARDKAFLTFDAELCLAGRLSQAAAAASAREPGSRPRCSETRRVSRRSRRVWLTMWQAKTASRSACCSRRIVAADPDLLLPGLAGAPAGLL